MCKYDVSYKNLTLICTHVVERQKKELSVNYHNLSSENTFSQKCPLKKFAHSYINFGR